MAGSGLSAQRIIIRKGMAKDIPVLEIGEPGWDADFRRLRIGDGTPTPPMIMTDKSIGIFKYDFIDFVEFPQINMLPDGTVDGVDISDLNQTNGYLVRRGDNLWASRTIINTDGFVKITNGNGTAGNTSVDFSDAFKATISQFLTFVSVDNITIHGNGRPEAPLFAHTADQVNKGVVKLATDQETIDGVSEAFAITPGGLSARTATQQRTGIVRLSTQADVDAAVDLNSAVSPGLLKHFVDGHIPTTGGYYLLNVISQNSFANGGESNTYNTSDLTFPNFLKVTPNQNVVDYSTSGGSGGGAGSSGTGPTNIGVKVNGNTVSYLEFTVFQGVLYGVYDYGWRAIVGVGGTINFEFKGTQFSADGVNLFTGGVAIIYQRQPFNPG